MNLEIYDMVFIFVNIFMTYVVYRFMGVFYAERITDRKIELLSYGIYFVAINALHLLSKIPMVYLISNLLIFFMITLNYKSSIQKRILTTVLVYLILMCIEMIIVMASGYFRLDFLVENNYESILGLIIIKVISFVVVLIIESYQNIRQGDIVPNTYWLCILTIPIGTLYLLITIFSGEGPTITTIFISTTLVLMINFGIFYLYDEISKILSDNMDRVLMQQQNIYYEKQFELMKTSLKATNTIKHDLKNHLTSLYILAEENKKEELLDYLSDVVEVMSNKKEFAATGNVVIDSIINFKLQEIEKDHISVNLDLKIPKELEFPTFDMTVILGNLLDNALNAVRKLEENRYIDIKMKYTKGRLILKIENSFDGMIIEQDGVIDTSHNDKINHGIGLQSVQTVIKKYDGTIECEYDRNKFHTALLMYV